MLDHSSSLGDRSLDLPRFFFLSSIFSLGVSVLTYPFRLAATRQQVQGGGGGRSQYGGVRGAFSLLAGIVRRDGVRGIYRGFLAYGVLGVPSEVAYFASYSSVRGALERSEYRAPASPVAIAAVAADLIAMVLWTPVDVVSRRFQIQSGANAATAEPSADRGGLTRARYTSLPHAMRLIYVEEGLRGFFVGLNASLAESIPGSIIWWLGYHALKAELLKPRASLRQREAGMDVDAALASPLAAALLAGGMSGALTCILTNPVNVVKTQMMVYHHQHGLHVEAAHGSAPKLVRRKTTLGTTTTTEVVAAVATANSAGGRFLPTLRAVVFENGGRAMTRGC
jgi:hypothetical protein